MLSFIKKILKGEISLPIMFWVFHTLAAFLWGILINFSYNLSVSLHTLMPFHVMLGMFIVYLIIIYIGLWNSATQYSRLGTQGIQKFYVFVSKLIVIIGLLTVTQVLYKVTFYSTDNRIEKIVNRMNAKLPEKMDKYAEISRVVYYDKTFNLYNTLNIDATNPEYKKYMPPYDSSNTIRSLCTDVDSIVTIILHIDPTVTVNLIFSDNTEKEVGRLTFTYDRCKPYYHESQ